MKTKFNIFISPLFFQLKSASTTAYPTSCLNLPCYVPSFRLILTHHLLLFQLDTKHEIADEGKAARIVVDWKMWAEEAAAGKAAKGR